MVKTLTIEEAKCPVCKRWVNLDKTRIVTHGPGKDTMFCKGGGSTHIKSGQRIRKRIIEVGKP